MDCKKALQEADGDFEAAIDVLRKKGQKVAAKRADREASEEWSLPESVPGFRTRKPCQKLIAKPISSPRTKAALNLTRKVRRKPSAKDLADKAVLERMCL